jgi:hypothetical protein
MATARSQKNVEFDLLTVNQIFVRGTSNTYISSFHALMSDGIGGTYWSTLSTAGPYSGDFQVVKTSAATYIPDASSNRLNFRSADGITFVPSKTSNATSIFAKAFNTISVPDQAPLLATQTNPLSTITFSSIGNTRFTTDPSTFALIYSVLTTNFTTSNYSSAILNQRVSTLTLMGLNGIFISTGTTDSIALTTSSFTSNGFVALQEQYAILNEALFSTLQVSYVPTDAYEATFTNLSTTLFTSTLEANSTIDGITANTFSSLSTLSKNEIALFSTTSNFLSTITTLPLTTISNDISTFSTHLLCGELSTKTIALTNSTFNQPYYYGGPGEKVKNFAQVCLDTYSTMSTTISIFDYWVKTVELISTSTNIEKRYKYTPTQIKHNVGPTHSTFATTITSTFLGSTVSTANRLNIWSTLPFTVYTNPQPAIGKQFNLLFSTCEVNISTLTPYIDKQSRVFLEYTPNFSFNTFGTYMSNGNAYSANAYSYSTVVSYTSTSLTGWQDYWNPQDPYSRPLRLELSTGFLLANHSCPFQIQHYLSNVVYVNNNLAPQNPLGGKIIPSYFTQNCEGSTFTRALWTNSMSRSDGLAFYIHDALHPR